MNNFEERLHRTWVQLLIDHNYVEIAAIAVDSEITTFSSRYMDEGTAGVTFHIPTPAYSYVKENEQVKKVMERAISAVSDRHLRDGEFLCKLSYFDYCIKLLEPEENWQNVVRSLIASAQNPNQGSVTEKVFHRNGKPILTYNEMKFGSQAEIRIAQELESRKILFFPLPLAVRAETGNFYQDHREPDFLICHEGVWGILEVSRHSDRYEKDAEKAAWFEKSGILCVKHYTAERCYKNSAEVVDEFLGILKQHKR